MSRIRATYRVQLTADFGFQAAAAITPYLKELGVSHLYCSPYLQALPGSRHGYDVVDPSRVNAELGGEEGHRALIAALAEAGLGQVLDIVPNHMAIEGRLNRWWWDVLENGPSSRYASYFDVSWDPPEAKLKNRILVPVLADHYGRVLEDGQLRVERDGDDHFKVCYHEHEFPVAPDSHRVILAGLDDELAAAFAAAPVVTPFDRKGADGRRARVAELRRSLARVPAAAIDARLAELNADPDRLDELLEHQNYRLARWQTAGFELDYRRFFDVTGLAAIRVEDEDVFRDTHQLVLDWLEKGELDGLRIDHPDGLRDPEGYFRRLREAAPAAWLVAEKILAPDERLPESWPVDGTTGYDFLNRCQGLFVDPRGERGLTEVYVRFTGDISEYPEIAYEKKQLVMRELLASDLTRLVALFVRVCEGNRRYRDFTRRELAEALREAIACLRVYRAYAHPDLGPGSVSEQDRHQLETAFSEARRRRPDLDPDLLDFLHSILLLEVAGEVESELVARFQQTSGPVAAKGVEDTAFYVYNRLVALNEVGGDPARFGIEPGAFHAACLEARESWPRAMLASSTHDTKRSEDVRARLALLSEIPADWQEAVRRWSAINHRHRRDGMPDRNDEYLLYQTLVGAYPLQLERALGFMEKAVREAKVNTSWLAPSETYEAALRDFIEGALGDPEFRTALADWTEPLVDLGRVNSLALKLLTLTAPGVPDLFQGSELWDLSLVDPDNRRPVDFELRRRLLAEVDEMGAAEAWSRRDTGLPKLLVVSRTLRLRAQRPAAFEGDYRPLPVAGERAPHVVAFVRGEQAVTLSPRLVMGLAGEWGDTVCELPPGDWRDVFTSASVEGGEQAVADLLADFPVALLARL